MSQSRCKRDKYILLETEDDENISLEVPRGEILEVLDRPDISKGVLVLFDTQRQLKLTCPSKVVARLTDLDAERLLAIRSPEERYVAFQERNRFKLNEPRKGTNVFVTVQGREFCGIVMKILQKSSGVRFYGVVLFNEVELEEHSLRDGTFETCEQDEFYRLTNRGIGVLVSQDKLRPRYEKERRPPNYQICKDLEQKSNESERELARERKARKDAENRLQNCETKVKDYTFQSTEILEETRIGQTVETTLAKALKSLKKRELDKQCDWVLKREEIHLNGEVLGSGNFGTVRKGMFRGTPVAVKEAKMKPEINRHNVDNFRREMRMAARCRHPCMLQFIGATSDDQSPLLVTELLDTSLRAVLHQQELEPAEIKTIALDVAKGLNYLHLNQPNPIVHRDVSSGNVLLWKHGESRRGKVSDYGNAVMMNYARTGSGAALPYLAPEINDKRFSIQSNVYSYGVLLLEMYHGKLPWMYDKDELICLVENGDLRKLIRGCLEQDPTQRPSMEDIISTLDNLTL